MGEGRIKLVKSAIRERQLSGQDARGIGIKEAVYDSATAIRIKPADDGLLDEIVAGIKTHAGKVENIAVGDDGDRKGRGVLFLKRTSRGHGGVGLDN